MAYPVLVEASAPGARIEVNGEYVGDAPITIKVFGDRNGTFHDFGSHVFWIRALPIHTNQFPQVRIYRTGRGLTPDDRIPGRIYFDMTVPPPAVQAAPPVYVVPPAHPGPSWYYYGPPWYGPPYRYYYHGYYHGPYRRW